MIIWQGLGFLVAVIAFLCSLAANLISNAKMGDGYYDQHKWPLAVALIVSAILCWILGNALRKRSARIVIDKQTGQELAINRSNHTLFFIPMHWWGPVLLLISLILLAIEFLRPH
jgi:hypothetical protein